MRAAGLEIVEVQSAETPEDVVDLVAPAKCQIILISGLAAGQNPTRLAELLNGKHLKLPYIIVTELAGEELSGPYFEDHVWDFVSKHDFWRLPFLARRIIENFGLEEQLRRAHDGWAQLSHDVRNLLTAVLAHSEFILDRVQADKELRRAVEGILKAGEMAAGWARPPAMERLETSTPPSTDLNQWLLQTETLLCLLAGDKIQLSLKLWPDPIHVITDAGELTRVLVNLVLNACEAMPSGGRLTVATETVTSRPGSRNESAQGFWAKITVADSGIGIHAQDQSQIFSPTYTTKKNHQGLGLPAARTLVEDAGGKIELKSAEGQGAAFSIYLPQAAAQPNEPANGSESGVGTNRVRKILLVEDDPTLREIISRILSAAGYCVFQAGSGDEALRIQRLQPGSIDLLLTDIRMGSMTGCALAEALRARQPGIRTIYISGYAGGETISDMHGEAYLMKPFKPTSLLQKIEEVLQG